MPASLLTLLGAYLLGSIPFSYLVARGWGIGDVRSVGSGNVGASNVMRSAGVRAGLLAFALDALKGAAASLAALAFEPQGSPPALAAAGAVLGHIFPVWLGFRGGKGVATGAGAFLPLAPVATASALLAFGLTLGTTRYVSLASISGAAVLAAGSFVTGAPGPVARAAAGIAALIVWKHRSNLERLGRGAEPRFGKR